VSGVATSAGSPSGVALITVDDGGENTIIVVPGANGEMGEDDVTRLDGALEDAHVLLVQLEVPLDAVMAAARAAQRHGGPLAHPRPGAGARSRPRCMPRRISSRPMKQKPPRSRGFPLIALRVMVTS